MRRAWWMALVLVSTPVWAQPVVNPSAVVFTPSVDHAIVTAYELGYFAVGASAPTQATSIPKASLTAAGADVTFPFPRLLFGTYDLKLRACAATVCSEWVPADKQGTVTPFGPRAVRLGS